MKIIEKYVANDGSEFKNAQDALNRDALLKKIDDIESTLPERNETTDFVNGHGFIQHDKTSLFSARMKLVVLADEYVDSFMSTYDLKGYAFGRYLDDSCYPLYKLYNRIVSCVDDATWREYGQPYYANNPNEADQFQVN